MKRTRRRGGKPTSRQTTKSWDTSDQQEIDLRIKRAKSEPMSIRKQDDTHAVYGNYTVERKSKDETTYPHIVELRSVTDRINTCDCPDFAKNALGTCKHIERVLLSTAKRAGRKNNPFAEVFVKYVDGERRPHVRLPAKASPAMKRLISDYVDATGLFRQPFGSTLSVFLRSLKATTGKESRLFRVSSEIQQWAEEHARSLETAALQKNFEAHHRNSTYLRYPLYEYQEQGMKHLAFNGRAMLTDEMGLGKTVQAVAAAKALRDMHGIRRVLIVCPASLKTEWEEQIRKFTSLTAELIYGLRPQRLRRYEETDAFFLVSNYEQIIRDCEEINTKLQPDLVILDEAQRIKNWKTKTAQSIKRLQSRFAFVLTGTPLENRIDEVYSLTEFVDSSIFGSLFRFNRDFYQFDERGKVAGLKNLRGLHEKLQPIMLRRRKDEIEEQLPERIDNNFFVPMTKEQKKLYGEHEYQVMIVANIAKRRPLRPEEFDRLQRHLACMRMACDAAYILDQSNRESPKVDELEKTLSDIWSNEPERKVIIFSEWVRMLELVRDMLDGSGVETCLHIGSVPQQKRREEINRFRNDPNCRVFLSSDSGSVGLNLQNASVVINLDLPWNPAKLEQRIARAWRKNQRKVVNVINFVSEGTIEHRMLSTLSFKQGLSDAVLDARGDFGTFEKVNAKAAFMEKLSQVLGAEFAGDTSPEQAKDATAIPPAEQFKDEVVVADDAGLAVCSIKRTDDERDVKSIFAVAADPSKAENALKQSLSKSHCAAEAKTMVLSLDEFKLLQKLAGQGFITLNDDMMEDIVRRDVAVPEKPDTRTERADAAAALLKSIERQAQMAALLRGGGFAAEAMAPSREVAGVALKALYVLADENSLPMKGRAVTDAMLTTIRKTGWLTAEQLAAATAADQASDDPDTACQQLLSLQETAELQRLRLVV